MVYSSDFYTTRRPTYSTYSTSRPYISSYNVTPLLHGPFYYYNPYIYSTFVRTLPHMPYVAHKRLVTVVHTPVRIYHSGTYLPIKIHSRVRPSILAAELNRIRYLTRPSYKSYTENYLNSRDYIDFDDETKEIRAKTDDLLRRIHVFVPRPVLSHYNELSPERLRSDDYVRRIINAKNLNRDIEGLPWYGTPAIRDIGTGNLACIKYAGGRPQARRRPYYTVSDVIPGDVKSDVNLMSFYLKNRKAAEDASPNEHHSDDTKEATSDAPGSSSFKRTDEVPQRKETRPQPEEEQAVTQDDSKETEAEVEVEAKPEEDENEEVEYDENGVKKQPDEDTIKKVQEYLDKKAAEKKMEEDRRAWEAAERRRIAEEKEIARLAQLKIEEDIRIAEIKDQERREAERQAVIERAEAARLEAERLIEDEKLYKQAVAQAIADEEERVAKEKEKEREELERERREEEDRLANMGYSVDNQTLAECLVLENSEDHSGHFDYSDQDQEAKPYAVDNDDDSQIQEDDHEDQEDIENPFTYGENAAKTSDVEESVADAPQIKESNRDHGEQGFDWSQYESEAEDEASVEAEAPQAEENSPATVDQQQTFEESDVKSDDDADEAQIEELEVTDDESQETLVQESKSEEKNVDDTFENDEENDEEEKDVEEEEKEDDDEEEEEEEEEEEDEEEDEEEEEEE